MVRALLIACAVHATTTALNTTTEESALLPAEAASLTEEDPSIAALLEEPWILYAAMASVLILMCLYARQSRRFANGKKALQAANEARETAISKAEDLRTNLDNRAREAEAAARAAAEDRAAGQDALAACRKELERLRATEGDLHAQVKASETRVEEAMAASEAEGGAKTAAGVSKDMGGNRNK